MTEVHRDNAARFSDNFAIMDENRINLFGCEHNTEEANAIAQWIYSNTGRKTVVIANTPDQVRKSKELRGSEPIRYQAREEALIDMGVWAQPKRRRRSR